jgi:hypothetical protein
MLKKTGFALISILAFYTVANNLPIAVRINQAIAAAVLKFRLPPPPNRGITGNRLGGASRIADNNPIDEGHIFDRRLTALVPEYRTARPVSTKVWGLTASEYPSLWFYIPYAQNSIDRIDFILTDGDNSNHKIVYKNAIEPPTKAAITNFTLPRTSPPLEIGKLYQWELKLTMRRQLEKEISVKGWMQRTKINNELGDRLKQATPDRQAALYAENGLWYDALSTLAQLHRDRPNNLAIKQDWQHLLDSVDLGKLADRQIR